MKKLLLILIASTCIALIAGAQEKGSIHIGAGIDGAFPLGDFGEGYGFGIGASAKGMYGINDAGQATLTLGFLRFGMKDGNELFSGSTSLIPVLVGYRHRFSDLYAEGQVGLTAVRTSIKIKDAGLASLAGLSASESATHFGYAVGAGYLMGNLDLGLRFQGVAAEGGSLNFVALRVAYNFQLK